MIRDFVKRAYLPDLVKIDNWIYYSPENFKVVIDSYHPSARMSCEDMYQRLTEAYKAFIDQYPKFMESGRV